MLYYDNILYIVNNVQTPILYNHNYNRQLYDPKANYKYISTKNDHIDKNIEYI